MLDSELESSVASDLEVTSVDVVSDIGLVVDCVCSSTVIDTLSSVLVTVSA